LQGAAAKRETGSNGKGCVSLEERCASKAKGALTLRETETLVDHSNETFGKKMEHLRSNQKEQEFYGANLENDFDFFIMILSFVMAAIILEEVRSTRDRCLRGKTRDCPKSQK